MSIKSITFALIFCISSTAKAENHMLIMGGGGEKAGETTIFDSTMKTLGNNLKSAKWKTQVSFNGGHAETEKIMSAYPTETPLTDFTEANYLKMLSEYKAKILLGEIKAGDQMMVIMNTHGAMNTRGQKTHLVATGGNPSAGTTDYNSLSGSKLVSMDALEELIKLTNERGIKLGIVDLSCHSGATQALKTNAPNTCIITATGPNHFGFAGDSAFSGQFMKNLKKGTTLENAFLTARADSNDASFPMISTDESKSIVAEVYASLTPYLYYYDPDADKMADYILQTSKDCVTCKRETEFASLMAKITELELAAKGQKTGYNARELKKLLSQYKIQQDELINAQRKLGAENLDNKETFSSVITVPGIKKPYMFERKMSWRDIIEFDADKTIQQFEGYRDRSQGAGNKADNQVVINGYMQMKQKQKEIMEKYPKLKTLKEESKKIALTIGKNRDIAEKIAMQEKKFYDELYRQKQSLNMDEPCRRITF